MLVNSYIGRVCRDERAILPLATVSIVTENTNSPELVCLFERAIDVQNIDGQLLHVQFLLKLAGNMERLLSQITEDDNNAVGVLLEEVRHHGQSI
jgi:hypothetical protein